MYSDLTITEEFKTDSCYRRWLEVVRVGSDVSYERQMIENYLGGEVRAKMGVDYSCSRS